LAIGAFAAWGCQKIVKGKAVNAVLTFAEDHPPWFYLGAFVVTCELAQMFINVRNTAHALTKVFHRSLFDAALIFGIAVVGVMFGAGVIANVVRRRTRVLIVKKPEDPNVSVPL